MPEETPSAVEAGNDAEHADEVPKKRCQYVEDHGEHCDNVAVTTVWCRNDHRVNDHGVHISTKVRPVFVCEEHNFLGQDVPAEEAEVVGFEEM